MLRVVQASKLGPEYQSRSSHPWQWYELVMTDGTVRHTSVPAGLRAAAEARRNVNETPREPTGAGHWHRPDMPRVADALPCPAGCK